MTKPSLDRSFGREAFGADPANYHAARPAYPEAVWQALRDRAGLEPGIDLLEIGAGTGLATTPLLAHQPRQLVAIEPDARLATFLQSTIADPRLEILAIPFEAAEFAPASFDLVACATAFHWLDAVPALERIHQWLRPGGAVALWWNVFGDNARADAFHDATAHLFAGQRSSPSDSGPDRPPHALDTEARLKDLEATGFIPDQPERIRWTLSLDATGMRDLYATYSNVSALAPAERTVLLDGLAEIATNQFANRIERNMTTAIYTARR